MKAYHLGGSSDKIKTATELLALGVDVVVVSYDFVETSARARCRLPEELDQFTNDRSGLVRMPKRPNDILHSAFWRRVGLPFKRVVLDEAQVVNKRNKPRHDAIKSLYYDSIIVMSGNLPHNKWHNFSGYVDFLAGHPFEDHQRFLRAFSTLDYDGRVDRPEQDRMIFLQRFLMRFTIARPSSMLKLKDCHSFRRYFNVDPAMAGMISEFVEAFEKRRQMKGDKLPMEFDGSEDGEQMGLLVQAQLASMHPAMVPPKKKKKKDAEYGDEDEDDEEDELAMPSEEMDAIYDYVDDKENNSHEKRRLWLEKVADMNMTDLYHGSNRLSQFVKTWKKIRQQYPDRKVVVFSSFLKFLDLVAAAIKQEAGIFALHYDGSVAQGHRPKVQKDFEEGPPDVPLLLTSGAGGFGLNITCASVVIQTEIWWNANVEAQARARVHRQKQTEEVLYLQLFALNSDIDCFMAKAQHKKGTVNSEVMKPIVRDLSQALEIPALLRGLPEMPVAKFKQHENLKEL